MLSLTNLGEFSSKLEDQLKMRRRWASKNHISCFRVYDQEVGDFPFLADLYEDRLVFSYLGEDDDPFPPEFLAAVGSATGIAEGKLYFKRRAKKVQGAQYEKLDEKQESLTAREGGLKFKLNLSDYLDTGLFLDHRWTRSYVRDASAGMKVLNLFCYTGSFTVYAAHGGAFETTSVDLNQNYLDWAAENLALNGLEGPRHRFLRRDCMEYLRTETRKGFDLIVLDPPTFSNSKKMDGTLDVQRDHVWLVQRCMALLNREGMLFFSNNYQNFRLDTKALAGFRIQDISSLTVPRDFRKSAHKAFLITAQDGPELQLKNLDQGAS